MIYAQGDGRGVIFDAVTKQSRNEASDLVTANLDSKLEG